MVVKSEILLNPVKAFDMCKLNINISKVISPVQPGIAPMILCDVVSESVFCSKSFKILKLLSANFGPEREMINSAFHQEEFVDIGIKEFTSIRIQIVDTTGELIQSKQKYPARCQIQFMKSL